MIGFPEEGEACEWAVGMCCLYVGVCACICFCAVKCVRVCEVVVCMPWQEVGATTEQCLCNVSDV